MAIEVKQTVSVTYSEAEIKRLIVQDLHNQGISVDHADIRVSISGGHEDETWKSYGGPRVGGVEIVPVSFNGFVVHKETKGLK